jgi:hypothetical protein
MLAPPSPRHPCANHRPRLALSAAVPGPVGWQGEQPTSVSASTRRSPRPGDVDVASTGRSIPRSRKLPSRPTFATTPLYDRRIPPSLPRLVDEDAHHRHAPSLAVA